MTQARALLLIVACLVGGRNTADGQSFYSNSSGLFSTRPSDTTSLTNIKRFGPVGMGIDLLQPAFVMRISHIEDGSPAAATGKLEAGQIIESINGQQLADIDPRIQLGQILAAAEAGDGVLRFEIKDEPEDVVVNIQVLGAYSETWPLDCPKSDRIVRQVADYLAGPDSIQGTAGIGMLFLLSTAHVRIRTHAEILETSMDYSSAGVGDSGCVPAESDGSVAFFGVQADVHQNQQAAGLLILVTPRLVREYTVRSGIAHRDTQTGDVSVMLFCQSTTDGADVLVARATPDSEVAGCDIWDLSGTEIHDTGAFPAAGDISVLNGQRDPTPGDDNPGVDFIIESADEVEIRQILGDGTIGARFRQPFRRA